MKTPLLRNTVKDTDESISILQNTVRETAIYGQGKLLVLFDDKLFNTVTYKGKQLWRKASG